MKKTALIMAGGRGKAQRGSGKIRGRGSRGR